MKVIIISKEYPPHVYGGAGIHVTNLARELSRLMNVEVRCFGDQYDKASLRVKGYKYWQRMNEYKEELFTEALRTLSCDLSIVRDPIDSIVHTHTWYTSFAGFLAKRLYKVPLVVTCHSLEPYRPWKEEQLGTGYNLSLFVEKLAIENADIVIAVSEAIREDIIQYYNVTTDKVVVIHNGIDLDRWMPKPNDKIRDDYGIRGKYIFFVGRISRQKGIITLIDALKYLKRKDLQIVLRSGAADTEEFKHEVEKKIQNEDNIIWIRGNLEEEELMELYSEAELFVCPSTYEPFGIVNLEAMACEKAVVASAVGGIKEIVVNEKTGLLIPPSDPEALANAINRLLGDKNLSRRFGKAGRKRVEKHFSWARIANKTKAVYEELIKNYDNVPSEAP